MFLKFKILGFYLISCVFVILFSSNVFTQVKTLTLDAAIKTALENNIQTNIAKQEVQKARHAVSEAYGYAYPTIDLSGNFSHFINKPKMAFPDFFAMLNNSTYDILFDEGVIDRDESKKMPMGYTLQSFVLANSYEAKADVSQVLFSSAVFRGIGATQIYLETSQFALKSTAAKTILDVQKAFYGILLLKDMLNITNASLKNAEDNLRNVTSLHNGGLVSEYDLLQAEVQVENFRPVVVETENSLRTALDGLKVLLNIPQSEEIDVIGDLQYQDLMLSDRNMLVERAVKSNLDIKTLEYKQKVDKAFIDLDLADYWPTLVAFGSMSYNGTSDDLNFINYNSAVVGLSLNINLFQGNRTKHRVQQAKITAEQTNMQHSLLKEAVSAQVRSKVLEIEKVKRHLDAQERNVSLAERAFELSNIRYREGEGSQLEIQNAEHSLRQARINRLKYVHDYIVAQSELNELLGEVNPEYLKYVENN